jgi:hypothetical protein
MEMKFTVEFRAGNTPNDILGVEEVNSNWYAVDMGTRKVATRKYPRATEAWIWDAHDYRDDNPTCILVNETATAEKGSN